MGFTLNIKLKMSEYFDIGMTSPHTHNHVQYNLSVTLGETRVILRAASYVDALRRKGSNEDSMIIIFMSIKKKSGWRTPELADKSMKFSDIIDQALEPVPMYDDWLDWRDGMRNDEIIIIKLRDKLKKLRLPKDIRRRKLKNFIDSKDWWHTFVNF